MLIWTFVRFILLKNDDMIGKLRTFKPMGIMNKLIIGVDVYCFQTIYAGQFYKTLKIVLKQFLIEGLLCFHIFSTPSVLLYSIRLDSSSANLFTSSEDIAFNVARLCWRSYPKYLIS